MKTSLIERASNGFVLTLADGTKSIYLDFTSCVAAMLTYYGVAPQTLASLIPADTSGGQASA